MNILVDVVLLVGGYILSIFTWPTVKGWFVKKEAVIKSDLQKDISKL